MSHSGREPPAGAASWDVDPYAPSILCAPNAYYEELRERGPLVWLSRYGIWASGRYDEVQTIFSDWRRFCSSRGVGLTDFETEAPWRPPSIILEVDPPEHERTRSVLLRSMSPKALAGLKDAFFADAQLLVEHLLEKGTIDAVPELAEAYPLKVFPDAVGLEADGRENLLAYANMVFNALGPDNAIRQEAFARAAPVTEWIARKCQRDALRADGFGASIYAAADAGEIEHDEAALLVRSLLSAGVDTTVAGLGRAVLCLAQNPDQWKLLKQAPDLARNAFTEALRHGSPVHSFCRTANLDTEVSGTPIREGDKILCVLASANLDPRQWDEPEEFDIRRATAGQVAFGTGIHACVGQQVARLEGQAVLETLAARVDAIELAAEPVWRPGNALTALASLPLTLR
jgi:cytochrome P450